MEEPRSPEVDAASQPPGQRSLWSIFSRRLWIVALTAAGVFFGALLVGLTQPKVYQATALILISEVRDKRTEIETPVELFERVESELPIQLRLIRRLETADKVRDALSLEMPSPRILGGISVERLSGTRMTNLLALNYNDTDPERTQEVANEWAKVYVEESKGRGTESFDAALRFVQEQLDAIEDQLSATEEKLTGINPGHPELTTDETGNTSALAELETSLADNRAQQAATKAEIGQVQALLAEEPKLAEEYREEPTTLVRAMQEELSRLQVQRQQMLETYKEDTPEIQGLDERIQHLEDQLATSSAKTRTVVARVPNQAISGLRGSLNSLRGQLAALEAQAGVIVQRIAEKRDEMDQLPDAKIEAARLRRSQRVLEETHSMLLSRLYELQVEKAMAVPNVQVVQEADRPTQPIKPRMMTLAGLGLILGLLLGVTLAVVVDQVEDTFADVDEISTYTGKRLLGAIPHYREMQTTPLAAHDHVQSGFANAIRMTASNLRFLLRGDTSSSIVITSAGRAEGKTTLTANLAAALAAAGEEVLVVDGDLHKPGLHQVFGAPSEPGLSNILIGQAALEDVIQATSIPGVKLLSAGPRPPNATDILARDESSEMVRRISRAADVVLWDTPPAALLPDASTLAAHTDATLFVVGKGVKRRLVRQTLSHFQEAGMDVVGLVANQVRPAGGYYYYYYYELVPDNLARYLPRGLGLKRLPLALSGYAFQLGSGRLRCLVRRLLHEFPWAPAYDVITRLREESRLPTVELSSTC